MAFVENPAHFLADFGETVTVGGASVQAIFDAAYAFGGVGPIGMGSTQPALTLASTSVPADPEGQAAVVRGASYTVASHEPDGTGFSRLLLEVA